MLNVKYKIKWQTALEVTKALFRKLIKNPKHYFIAAERMKECYECEYMSYEEGNCAMPYTQPCCAVCGCSLKLKIWSDDKCPLDKWKR